MESFKKIFQRDSNKLKVVFLSKTLILQDKNLDKSKKIRTHVLQSLKQKQFIA
mgnify:CR=1 FL=1